ncbi:TRANSCRIPTION FACTOR C2H2 FAMILY-RELATED [Salix purpurea]|uniref:RING-type E3 ubiquitin transferase n=1 Tax=Salix purpurea TaxID=77065 RepID=A0A9Q0PED4_SALPP|nr:TRANSCRIPTION FACTOR C2H2 FAMILY-RELATED [Salix purpurea]
MYSPNSSLTSPRSDAMDSSPLLTHSIANHLLRSRRLLRRPPQFRGAAARILRRASSRRMMLREPSVRVRENAAEQLEERQSDWGYSKPIVVIDVLWNLAIVIIAVGVLGLSLDEKPRVPFRAWIVAYVLLCSCHVFCVVVEYRKRRNLGLRESGFLSSDSGDSLDFRTQQSENDGENSSVAKRVESAMTTFSIICWIIGFYLVTTAGHQNLAKDSPQLYGLCFAFLAADALFVIICIAVACLIGIAVCCCLPCIIGILYAMADQEGASKEEIDRLLKYKFHKRGDCENVNDESQESFGGMMTECDTDTPIERALSHEDTECCICLSAYEDGSELRELPCGHHFHCMCLDKWLCINATCPLCKFNILKADSQSSSEEA